MPHSDDREGDSAQYFDPARPEKTDEDAGWALQLVGEVLSNDGGASAVRAARSLRLRPRSAERHGDDRPPGDLLGCVTS
jgi:hypothetical protein